MNSFGSLSEVLTGFFTTESRYKSGGLVESHDNQAGVIWLLHCFRSHVLHLHRPELEYHNVTEWDHIKPWPEGTSFVMSKRSFVLFTRLPPIQKSSVSWCRNKNNSLEEARAKLAAGDERGAEEAFQVSLTAV